MASQNTGPKNVSTIPGVTGACCRPVALADIGRPSSTSAWCLLQWTFDGRFRMRNLLSRGSVAWFPPLMEDLSCVLCIGAQQHPLVLSPRSRERYV